MAYERQISMTGPCNFESERHRYLRVSLTDRCNLKCPMAANWCGARLVNLDRPLGLERICTCAILYLPSSQCVLLDRTSLVSKVETIKEVYVIL